MASSKAMATTGEHLPEDVTLQILYRTTMKALIRFSCTSKRWRSIIRDPQFAKTHFKLASQRNTLTQRLLLSTKSQVQSLDLQMPSFVDDSSVNNLTCPFYDPEHTIFMRGSCNGMLFIDVGCFGYYIWNPSTNMFLKLPNPVLARVEVHLYSGFGYISATNDYKAVLGGGHGRNYDRLEIFSPRANSWKIIEAPHSLDLSFISVQGSLSNEALHWVRPDGNHGIITFDLATEEFGNIPLPLVDENGDELLYTYLGVVLGGCLCVSTVFRGREHYKPVQLWVMMEYGVPKSWTKLFCLRMGDLLAVELPVFYTNSSIVFWRWGLSLNLLDHGRKDELVRFSRLDKDVAADCSSGQYSFQGGFCDMMKYDETLLWLNDHIGEEENIKRF